MKKTLVVMQKTLKKLVVMGEQIKLVRLRRDLSTKLVYERTGISRLILWETEKGLPSVSIGVYINVLMALGGPNNDILEMAKDNVVEF